MRKLVIFCLSVVLMMIGCAGQTAQQQPKSKLYTAFNIWLHKGSLHCINFKLGNTFIPAGTAVKDVESIDEDGWQSIRFRIADTNRYVSMFFNERWHPGQSAKSYLKKMFTEKNYDQLTDGLNPEEIRAIKGGFVTVGMSKRAVLIAYGVPPEHYTRDLSSDEWYYWMNKVRKKKICFDQEDRAQRCGQTRSDRL